MLVSHFELVYKPQSPVGPADTVLQGYFLKITNLEDKDFSFGLRFTTSSVSDPDRSLFQNAVVLVDTPGSNNAAFSLIGNLTSKSFRLSPSVSIPAHGTALVAVLPSDPFPPTAIPPGKADFECRGFVTLSLPLNIVRPQSKEPVKVLISAQNRTLYIDPKTGLPNGQSQASLPLSTGKALNEVESDILVLKPGPGLLEKKFTEIEFGRIADDTGAGTAILDMLSAISEAGIDLRIINSALKDSGVGMALEKRNI